MKKKLTAILIGLTVLMNQPICYAAESQNDDASETEVPAPIDGFRNVKWGTPMDEAKNIAISADMIEGEDYIIYDTGVIVIINSSVADLYARTYYEFDSDSKFYQGMYTILEEHEDKTDYYDDYCNLVELYTEKYGKPNNTSEDWKDDLYKNSPEDWGIAISEGDVDFLTSWVDDSGATINIYLSGGDNNEILFVVIYSAADHNTETDTSGI